MFQPFLGNGSITRNLAFQYSSDILYVSHPGKFIDSLHGKLYSIRQLLCILLCFFIKNAYAILYNANNMGMLILNTYKNRMSIPILFAL